MRFDALIETQDLRVSGKCNPRDKRHSEEEGGGQILKDLTFCFSFDFIPKLTENH